jgi:8-oxo-dGTP diphosphatase
MITYVCGFLFSEDGEKVLLIRKNRPEWMKGMSNGIGGKVEAGESVHEAMRREGLEEAGVDPVWAHFVTLRYPTAAIAFFAAKDNAQMRAAKALTDEPIVRIFWRPEQVANDRHPRNLRFLLPMAYHAIFYESLSPEIISVAGLADRLN